MAYKIRPQSLLYYRLFFVVLTFLVGFTCLGIVAIEQVARTFVLVIVSGVERDALVATFSVTGVASVVAGFIMLNLMKDRRQQVVAIDFPDRRTEANRRSR